ncbi:MAG: ATP synthase subunit I [Clostridia bacterium]|nr:ATP synthase subunit I [Clostridia bacterium]
MKLDPEVLAENRKMARDCLILTAVMAAGFLVARRFDLSVVWGLLIGYALAVGNFYFMSVGLTAALSTGDETAAKTKIRQSYLIRTLVMLAVMAFSLWTERIHWVPVIASVFYPRIVLAMRGAWTWIRRRRHSEEEPEPAAREISAEPLNESLNEQEEETPDEFEKFVSHFSKGPVPGEEKGKAPDEAEKEEKDGGGPGDGENG